MDISREIAKEKEKERKARKARMMKEKEENKEVEKENPTMFNLRPHRLLPYRVININNNNNKKKLITLQHEAKGMVSLQLQKLTQHMWMFWQPPLKSTSRKDALVEGEKTNVRKWHGRTEKEPRNFLSWLEILKQFVQVYKVDQQCPEKLVYKKAHHCLCMDTLRRQRDHLTLNARAQNQNATPKNQQPGATASSPFCTTTQATIKICLLSKFATAVLRLSLRLFDWHSLRVKIDSGNSISGSNVSEANTNLLVSHVSLDQSHKKSDIRKVWFRFTNPKVYKP